MLIKSILVRVISEYHERMRIKCSTNSIFVLYLLTRPSLDDPY